MRDVHRDIAAAPHSYAQIGRSQGRRIVDAVADHRDAVTSRLKLLHVSCLVGRQNPAAESFNPQALRQSRGRALAIARQEMHRQAFAAKSLDRCGRSRLDAIRNGKHGDHALRIGEINHGILG